MEPTSPSVAFGRALVNALVRNGIREVVLAPGSRSAPVALALAAADAAGWLRLHVSVDERGAGFLAVGLARGSGRAAAVLTTSGTAVANLHPAVLEAHHDHVPMLVLSADRPAALRARAANQVIDQAAVFTGTLRAFADLESLAAQQHSEVQAAETEAAVRWAVELAGGHDPGPVQLNLPMADPLLPAPGDADPVPPFATGESPSARPSAGEPLVTSGLPPDPSIPAPAPGERVLYVAAFGHPAAAAIAAAGHPVISEAGGAAGARVLAAGIPLLEAAFAASAPPDRVVVLGRPTLFRCVQRLLAEVPVVDVLGHLPDPTGRTRLHSLALDPIATSADPDFRQQWWQADLLAAQAIAESLASSDLAHSPVLARTLVRLLPGTADEPISLVVGSSQSPRDIGRFAEGRDGLVLQTNRGVAGIDGTISLAKGVALAAGRPTVALMGDLTFLHDATGLIVGPHEPRPDLTIVVANNDGGAIFSTLESGEPHHERHFERIFGTPTGADLAGLVAAFGAEHVLLTEADQLRDELRELQVGQGIRVLEVPTSRTDLRSTLEAIRERVRSALAG